MWNPAWKQVTVLSVLISTLFSCNNFSEFGEIEGIEGSPEFAVPILNTQTSIREILDRESVTIDQMTVADNGEIKFRFERDGSAKRASEVFQLEPSFPLVIPDTAMTVPAAFSEDLTVTKMALKTGTFTFNLQSYHTEDIDVSIRFPQFVKDGEVLVVEDKIVYSGTAPAESVISSFDLKGYLLTMPDGEMQIEYEAYKSSGERVMISPIIGSGDNWTYEYIEGDWEQNELDSQNDSLNVDFFNPDFQGDYIFSNPKLTLEIENSYGIPTELEVNYLAARNEAGETFQLTSTLFDSNIPLNFPSISEGMEGKMTSLVFTKDNSNIVEFLSKKPIEIFYNSGFDVMAESGTPVSGFVSENSLLKIDVALEIPASGSFSLQIEEETEIEFEENENISFAEFTLITDNGIPLDAETQFYFLDANNVVIDSLFSTKKTILEAASIDSNGLPISSTEQTVKIVLDKERMESVQNSKKLRMVINLNTSENASVPITVNADQTLGVRLGAIIGIEN